MTGTNHMLAGAVVATAIQQPLIVLPVALISHFVLDTLPHFGISEDQPAKRNKHPLFRYVLAIDISLMAALTVCLPLILKGTVTLWVLVLGMFLAWAPDLIWVREFFREMNTKRDFKRASWFARVHQKIQWFEKPWGLITEIVWFGAMVTVLGILAA